VVPIRIEDFICRPYYSDIQKAPWIAHRLHYMWYELLQREDQGWFQDVQEVKREERVEPYEREGVDLERHGVTPDDVNIYDIYECYLFWDVDGDGVPEDVIVWIEPESGVILREEFNDLGRRPFVRIPYFNVPHQLYGIGVGWMCEHLQDEIDALHNMRIDGTHLSMLQMYATRRGSGIGPNEEFRPLKNLQVDDPRSDIVPFKFPDIGPSTIQAEMITKEYSDRVTGATDYMMGVESKNIGTKATATGTMFLAEQSSRVFLAVEDSVVHGYSETGLLVLLQLIKNKNRVDLSLVANDKQEALRRVLDTSLEDIPARFRFSVKTNKAEQSEAEKRQAHLMVMQLYSQYGKEVFQMLPVIYNEQVPQPIKEVASKFFIGATKLMDKVLLHFGVDNPDEYLPNVKDLEMLMNMLEMMKGAQGGINTGGGGQSGIPVGGAVGVPQVGGPGGGQPQGGPGEGFGA